ncbi:radical SAM protein [Halorubrum laminariae]|uniref:Radical SAM protein n=1 Tax=Halorubrum laminariae TaxID=1433523 RepID=A0ABD6C1W9_9EURY|nr:radical SAM protein [Halorubrum laminariae]
MLDDLDTARRPLVLVWEVTQACGLACRHCRADARPERHPDELSTAEGKEILDDVRAFTEGQLVVLSGGDPMRRPDLVELVEYGTDIGLTMTLTPSGTRSLTGDSIEELAAAGLCRMAVSLDGATADAHDAFRGETGSFEETLRAARATTAAGLPLQINTTVCAQTVEELPAIADLVEELGAVLWSVFFLVPVGRGQILDPVSPRRAESVMSWLHDIRAEVPFGIKTTEAPHYRRVGIERRDRSSDDGSQGPTRRAGIVAGDGFAFVSHTGVIYPSGFLPKAAGDVRRDDVVDVYRTADLFQSLRDRSELSGKCGVCRYRNVCGGSRSRAYAATGDPLASDPLCAHVPDGWDAQAEQPDIAGD